MALAAAFMVAASAQAAEPANPPAHAPGGQGSQVVPAAPVSKTAAPYRVEVSSGFAASIQVFVNGLLVWAKRAGQSGVQSLPIQADVIPGQNKVDVLIGTADVAPATAAAQTIAEAPGSLFAVLKLQRDHFRRHGDGQLETLVAQVSSAEWRPEESSPVQVPHRLTLRFRAPADTPAPAWLAAKPVTPKSVREPLLARLEQLRGMLAAGQVDAFTAATIRQYADFARAYPARGSAADLRLRDSQELNEIVHSKGFAMAPIAKANAVCRVYASGRVAECVDPHGHALLRAQVANATKPIELAMKFSLVDGDLNVVR
jgi:hypothetical protein